MEIVDVIYKFLTVFVVKGKWQQKFNSSHLNEIQKQCVDVYYKILYLFYFERYSLNQETVRYLGLIFNFINYVLVTLQQGYAIQSYFQIRTNNQILFDTFLTRIEIRNTYRVKMFLI